MTSRRLWIRLMRSRLRRKRLPYDTVAARLHLQTRLGPCLCRSLCQPNVPHTTSMVLIMQRGSLFRTRKSAINKMRGETVGLAFYVSVMFCRLLAISTAVNWPQKSHWLIRARCMGNLKAVELSVGLVARCCFTTCPCRIVQVLPALQYWKQPRNHYRHRITGSGDTWQAGFLGES